MTPIAAVTGEPGRVETQDGSNLARAKPRHQSVAAGPGGHSAGGATKVVVDRLDVLSNTGLVLLRSTGLESRRR